MVKQDKKKYLILGGIAFLVILIAVCLLVNNNPENKIKNDHTFEVGGNVAIEDMRPLNQTTNLNNLLSNIKYRVSKDLEGINDDEANELLDLDFYEGLEKRVAVSDSENEYTEIWLLKTSEGRQEEKIFEYFEKRIRNLESSSNKNVEELFADPKSVIMKTQDNIAMIIVSKNAPEIEKIIDEEMSENGSKVININATASVSSNLTAEDKVTVKLENANENLNVNYLIFDSHDGSDYENNEFGSASGEIIYNEETRAYEKEIDLSEVTSDRVYLQVTAYDENLNMRAYRLGEVVVAKDGIVGVRTERKADGNIAVNVEAVEGGEICITTENVYPDDNANWQKYEQGKEYIYEDVNNSISEIYVFYKSSTVVTNPGKFASVGRVSWVTNPTYTFDNEYGTFTYIKDRTGKYAKITLCAPKGKEVIFPTYIEGLRVLSIGNISSSKNIFGTNSSYKDVILMQLPKGLEEIGERAFYNCSGLTGNLEIPEGVMNIGDYAFYNCNGFNGTLTIPEEVTSIGNYSFYSCSGFTGNLEIPTEVTSIGSYSFYSCSGFTGNLEIPTGVTSIGEYAFYNCIGFNGTLTISNTVASIGSNAFYNCIGFNGALTIPNTVTSIGQYAFYNCIGFRGTLTIPNTVTSIGTYAFQFCSGLTGEIVIPENVTNIGSAPFSGTSINNMTVNNANKSYIIIEEALCTIDGKTLIEVSPKIIRNNYEIPEEVTNIGSYAFYNCVGLTGKIVIPSGVTRIGDYAFYNCIGLTGNLTMPVGVTYIGFNAFCNCSGFTGNLIIPEKVTYIGFGAFKNCSGLTGNLEIPSGVTSIGSYVFEDCSGFNGTLTIPNTVRSIGQNAFKNCSGLIGNLVLPEQLDSLLSDAFYNCSGFTGRLIIPKNVTRIDESAFSGLSGLDYILLTRTESNPAIPTTGIGSANNLFALTQDIAKQYNTNQYWKKENYGKGVYPVLQVKQEKSKVIKGDNFEDIGGITLAGLTETSNDLFKTIKTYQKAGETGSSNVLDTNSVGVYTATYTLQMLNKETGNYEDVKGLNGKNEIVSRTIEVIEEDKSTETFEQVGSVNWVTKNIYTYTDEYGTFTYIKDSTSKYAKITFCASNEKEITFPTYIEKLRVITIGNLDANRNIFRTNSDVMLVQLPKGLVEVGSFAFSGCSSLTGKLVIPESVTRIEDYAFSGCRGLTGKLVIPESVTRIEDYAFLGCSGLTGKLVIPESVTRIGNSAFSGCSGFNGTLIIPAGVSSIGEYAFSGCTGLTGEIVIPENVTNIGSAPFRSTSIKNIIVGSTNESYKIIDEALCTIDGKTLIEVPPKIVRTNYKIPAGVTNIGDSAFYDCKGLTGNIEIPAGVTNIGYSAFYDCKGLTGILTIPEEVTNIGNYAFYNCSGFTGNLLIPSGVRYIGDYAFYNCSGFTGNLVIPAEITFIGYSAFENCSGFNGTLTILAKITSIRSSTFKNCSNLTGNLEIPAEVTRIESSAFENCSNLTGNLEIPAGVTRIERSAFENCSNLTGDLEIPAGVTSIESSTFENCSNLTGNLKIPAGVTSIGNYAFSGCRGLTGNLVIPEGVTTIETSAFSGCSGLTGNLLIPESVANIGTYAFWGCKRLDYILLARKENIPGNYDNTRRICDYKKMYALTQDLADKYNSTGYWNEENIGDGVYPVLRKALTTEYVSQGTNFVDKGVTVAGFVEDPNGLFKVVKSYKKDGSSVSSDTLDTSTQGTYIATYTLQIKNASGTYETVYDLSGKPEQVTRTIEVVEEEPYVTDIKVVSPVPGEYTEGTKITFNVEWNYAPNVTAAPELVYKFGENGKEKIATYVETKGNISIYTCTIEEGEEGILTLVAYEAGIVNDNYARSWISSTVTLDEEIIAKIIKPILMERETFEHINGKEIYYAIGAKRANKTEYTADKIKTITLQNTLTAPTGFVTSWDVSQAQDKSVMAWVVRNATNSAMYDLYIGAKGNIIAPENSDCLFGQYENCTTITGLNYLNTSSVTSMAGMFENNRSLTTLDLSNWDTSSVTNMHNMFLECNVLTNLNVSNWDTSSVTIMKHMFCSCSNLKTIDVSKWETGSVTDMSAMFQDCPSLTALDVSKWKTGSVTSMSAVFAYCPKLTNLNVSDWDTKNVETMKYMFYRCNTLRTLDVSKWETGNVKDMSDMFNMYESSSNLTTLDVSKWETGKVIDMSNMFNNCINLPTLDVSAWNTENVKNMRSMFSGCRKLTPLDVSAWNTGKVTNMSSMFSGCSKLTPLDVSKWETGNVTNMSNMFNNCINLPTLDVSTWNTGKVTNMSLMFSGCSKLTLLDVSKWETGNVTNLSQLFENCSSLTSLNLSGWNVEKVTDMYQMFNDCVNLKVILLGDNFFKIVSSSNEYEFINRKTAIITPRTEPMSFDANTRTSNAVLYVPNVVAETAFESAANAETVFGAERIRPILELIGESIITIDAGNTYTEEGATVAGFTTTDEIYYTQYGYTLEGPTGEVKTDIPGTYTVTYTVKRNGTEVMSAERTIIVRITNYTDGEYYYATLKRAFENAKSGSTITVLKDVEDNELAVVSREKKFTLDLAGLTITSSVSGNAFITNNGTLEMKDSKTTGEIDVNGEKYIVNNAGELTVTNGTYNITTGSGILSNGGSLTITGGKVESKEGAGVEIDSTTALVTIGTKGGGVPSITDPSIVGGTYGIYGTNKSFNFYDGILKGKTAAMSITPGEVEPGYEVRYGTERIAGEIYQTAVLDRILTYGKGTFITRWEIPGTDGYTVTLPVPANANNNYTIYWGDGWVETYTNQDFPTHTYTNALDQTFTMGIEGTLWYYGYYGEQKPTANNVHAKYYLLTDRLIEIVDWGSIHARRYGFSYCEKLQGSIPIPYETTASGVTGKTSFESIESMENLFYQCIQLGGEIPANFTGAATNMTSARNMFYNCQMLQGSIPADLFQGKTKIQSFAETFANCKSLTTKAGDSLVIPLGLFAQNQQVTTYYATFYNCKGLTGNVTRELWNTLTSLTPSNDSNMKSDYRSMFEGTGVKSVEIEAPVIARELFKNCSQLDHLLLTNTVTLQAEAFYGCNQLQIITIDSTQFKTIGQDAFEYTGSNPKLLPTWINRENDVLRKYIWLDDQRILDFEPPTGTVTILSDKYPFTNTRKVKLQITVQDNISLPEDCEVAIVNKIDFQKGVKIEDLDWQPYQPEMEWTLSDGDGEKAVYLFVRDEVENTIQY